MDRKSNENSNVSLFQTQIILLFFPKTTTHVKEIAYLCAVLYIIQEIYNE